MDQRNFIGFATSTDWRGSATNTRPVQAAVITQLREVGNGLANLGVYALMSQVDDLGNVRYCRIKIGGFLSQDGQTAMFPNEQESAERRASTARQYLLAWLKREGFGVIERAVVATPKDLVLLDGVAEFMKYDKASDSWVAVEDQKESEAPSNVESH